MAQGRLEEGFDEPMEDPEHKKPQDTAHGELTKIRAVAEEAADSRRVCGDGS